MARNKNDKYYTPDWLAEYTIKKAIEIIGKENITEIVESSAGDGAFIPYIKQYFPDVKQTYYDLYPEHPEIIKQDYKAVKISYKKGRLTGFNPPFGTSSSLWKAFCKKAATNSDYIVFISPGSQYKSNYYFKEGVLIYSELIENVVYRGSKLENGKDVEVRTCLNIYKVYERDVVEDWRLNKINSVIKYGRVVNCDGDIEFDYYLFHGTSGSRNLTPCKKNEYVYQWGVKILNEKYRHRIEDFLNNFYQYNEELKKLKPSFPVIDNAFFINKLKIFLFPTREERLEQDVRIQGYDNRYEYDEQILNDYDFFY